MDILLPLIILLSVIIIGLISKFLELGNIRGRYEFTAEYRKKFIDFINELFSKQRFNQQLYYELTSKVKEMQYELGSDGEYAYVQDNLKGYCTNNYQLLINFLPETRDILNDFSNSVMMTRYNQEAQHCDDMFVRHLGTLEAEENAIRKGFFNPFSSFAEGIKTIILLPLLIMNWFGFISSESAYKVRKNKFVKVLNALVAIISFVSAIITIVVGWNDFWTIIHNSLL